MDNLVSLNIIEFLYLKHAGFYKGVGDVERRSEAVVTLIYRLQRLQAYTTKIPISVLKLSRLAQVFDHGFLKR